MSRTKQVFNRDMDDYLSRRRTPRKVLKLHLGSAQGDREGLWTRMFARRVRAKTMPQDTEVDLDHIEAEIKELDAEIEEAREFQDEAKTQRESLFSRFLHSFKRNDRLNDEEAEEEAVMTGPPPLDPEVADVLKLSFKWISQLPPNKLSQFKESPDSTRYKNCLLKYGLVREKK